MFLLTSFEISSVCILLLAVYISLLCVIVCKRNKVPELGIVEVN